MAEENDMEVERLRQEAAQLKEELKQQREQMLAEKAELEQMLKKQQLENFNPLKALSEEERQSVDDSMLSVVTKVSSAVAQRVQFDMEKQAQDRLAKQQEIIRSEFLQATIGTPGSGLEDLQSLVSNKKFEAWLQSEEGAMADTALRRLAGAQIKEIPLLAKRAASQVQKFRAAIEEPQNETPAAPSAHMNRVMSRSSYQELGDDVMRRVKQLAASRNPADRAKAKELLQGKA